MTTAEWMAVIGGAVAIALSVVAFFRAGRQSTGPRPRAVGVTPKAAERVQSLLTSTAARRRQTQQQVAPVTDLRSAEEARYEATELDSDATHLMDQLVDIRDACGATEAVLWNWDESRDCLVPSAWSTSGAERPQHFRMDEWGPLAQWAAEGRLAVLDKGEAGTRPVFAAVAVCDSEVLVGVLTVANDAGLSISRSQAKLWMPRHAGQLLRLILVTDARREYARQTRQSRALLAAVRQIHTDKTPESLMAAICDTALQVTSASAAALVRWRSDRQKGAVLHATRELEQHRETSALDLDTVVSNVCRDGTMLYKPDVASMHPDLHLFAAGDRWWHTGSLGVVPLQRDKRVIGALVVASAEPGEITEDEIHNLSILGDVSATSLEMIWEIGEVSKRASTDALTGLVNRRAFDEQLKRLLNESDRFGQPLALILADIDHFKVINDSWGHEAGDEVLRWVAKRLGEGPRSVDVIARYGGEEFAILLPQTSVTGAADVADRLRRSVGARAVKWKGAEIAVTISLGVASYPDAVPLRDGLFRAADRALYEAKNAGRDCVRSVGVSQATT